MGDGSSRDADVTWQSPHCLTSHPSPSVNGWALWCSHFSQCQMGHRLSSAWGITERLCSQGEPGGLRDLSFPSSWIKLLPAPRQGTINLHPAPRPVVPTMGLTSCSTLGFLPSFCSHHQRAGRSFFPPPDPGLSPLGLTAPHPHSHSMPGEGRHLQRSDGSLLLPSFPLPE